MDNKPMDKDAVIRELEKKVMDLEFEDSLLPDLKHNNDLLRAEITRLEKKVEDQSPGTPLARLRFISDVAWKHFGHDTHLSSPPELAIAEGIDKLKAEVTRLEKELKEWRER